MRVREPQLTVRSQLGTRGVRAGVRGWECSSWGALLGGQSRLGQCLICSARQATAPHNIPSISTWVSSRRTSPSGGRGGEGQLPGAEDGEGSYRLCKCISGFSSSLGLVAPKVMAGDSKEEGEMGRGAQHPNSFSPEAGKGGVG